MCFKGTDDCYYTRDSGHALVTIKKDKLQLVPSDHVTTCATDWSVGGALTIHPLTVAYWVKRQQAER